jgi:signal transduction histidine kinase
MTADLLPTSPPGAPVPFLLRPSSPWRTAWRYGRALAAPVLLWVLVVVALREPVGAWLSGDDSYDQAALQEWLDEARGFRETLPEMTESYLSQSRHLAQLEAAMKGTHDPAERKRLFDLQVPVQQSVAVKREEIREHLYSLGNPSTKMYTGQLILFPTIYRLEVHFGDTRKFEDEDAKAEPPIVWDSELPSHASQYRELKLPLHPRAWVVVHYQLHAYNKRQRLEQEHATRLRQLGALALAGTVLAAGWLFLLQRREREQEHQRAQAKYQIDQAERRHEETERKLLEQRLATQAAERHALELKSQLYASIGIMAGSYAHNIKNLLVRPNDLLNRCLENDHLSVEQQTMLHEVRQTLGTVTERLQQILRTVRRDPSRSEQARLDLNAVVREMEHTWKDLARDKWKMDVVVSPAPGELPIAGDESHLQQAVENLVFNARDATFEMRSILREEARRAKGLDAEQRKQALIAAAAWRGRVEIRTRREGEQVVLEVSDNGAGMMEEVRRRCTETHFSTKRDNAIYEGHSTGMGLGLSFVVTILEHHHAVLVIESAPQRGTTFRVRFPVAKDGDSPPSPVYSTERSQG